MTFLLAPEKPATDAIAVAPAKNRDVVNKGVKHGGVTPRAVVLSLALAGLFGVCLPIVDYKMSNTFLGATHLPAAAVAVLLVLLLIVNPLLKLLRARAAFGRNEILVVYITCLFSSLVPGRGSENFFIPHLLAPFYFATRENKWLEGLQPYLKPWMTPALDSDGRVNTALISGWYEGTNGVVPWGAWLVPLLVWCAAIGTLYVLQACLGVMLRAQWASREALAFPLLRLPLELTQDVDVPGRGVGRFLSNPLMWTGFGVAVFIEMMNGLNLYFPEVPRVPMSLDSGAFFTEAPWNQMGGLGLTIFPAVLGIAFFLTSEVSFSLWFFHLFIKAQLMGAYLIGYAPATLDAPFWMRGWHKGFIGYQQIGGFLAFVALLGWTGREHWGFVARRAVGREKAAPDESREALSYPVAFWGFWGTLAILIAWTIAAGVSVGVALLLWGVYLIAAIGLARVVAEAGLMFVSTGWMALGPLSYLVGAGPGKFLDGASAYPASLVSGSLMFDMRGFLLPSFVQSFKLAHDQNIAAKPLLALIFAVTTLSFGLGVWMVVNMGYGLGGLQMQGWWARNTSATLHAVGIAQGVETDLGANWTWVSVGVLATWGMMAARSRFSWFPLHPVGLLMGVPFAMHAMWLSIFLAWGCKLLIVRFSGTQGYLKAVPLFLGLALGDIVMVVFWVIVDGWQGRTGHALLPF